VTERSATSEPLRFTVDGATGDVEHHVTVSLLLNGLDGSQLRHSHGRGWSAREPGR
jgi:hypothetical protein